MVHDPRRDPRAQRAEQLARRHARPLYPSREAAPHLVEQPPIIVDSRIVDEEQEAILMPAHGGMGSRFFEAEAQETDVDPLEWNENHPLWLAMKKGDVRMVTMPDGSTRIVDKREDIEHSMNDLLPRQKFAKGDFVQDDRVASLSQLQYRLGKSMVAYVICDFAQGGSPLLVRPVQADTTVPPVGGAILVAIADIGFEGAGETVGFDVLAGQTVKLPFAGQFGKLTARLMPKYYTPSDDNGTKTRTYLQSPGGQTLTSDLWNSFPAAIMAQNAFPDHNPQNVRGWVSEGILPNDLPRAPTRRFYGSVKGDATIADWKTICPIAFTATHVTLTGGAYDSAHPTANALQFNFRMIPTSGVAVPVMGPFNIGETVEIPNGAQSIEVFNSPNPVGAPGAFLEILFELAFSLSP